MRGGRNILRIVNVGREFHFKVHFKNSIRNSQKEAIIFL